MVYLYNIINQMQQNILLVVGKIVKLPINRVEIKGHGKTGAHQGTVRKDCGQKRFLRSHCGRVRAYQRIGKGKLVRELYNSRKIWCEGVIDRIHGKIHIQSIKPGRE